MQTLKDKRGSERYEEKLVILYSRKETERQEHLKGKMVNCSADGMAFHTFTALDNGEQIELYSPDAPHKCHARVVWCKENPTYDMTIYHIGVQYQDPFLQGVSDSHS